MMKEMDGLESRWSVISSVYTASNAPSRAMAMRYGCVWKANPPIHIHKSMLFRTMDSYLCLIPTEPRIIGGGCAKSLTLSPTVASIYVDASSLRRALSRTQCACSIVRRYMITQDHCRL